MFNSYSITGMGVQMDHRIAAILIFAWILYALFPATHHYQQQQVIYWGWFISFILVIFQAAAGILVVYIDLNLIMTLLHSLFISCLFAVQYYLSMLSTRSKREERNRDK